MKTSHRAAASAAVIAMCILVTSRVHADSASPSVPVGSLTAFPTVVQTGTKPTLTWSINYPSVVKDYIVITDPATVTPKENLICDIRILGLGVTSQNSNGTIKYYKTKGEIRYNGSSSWSTIYEGYQTDTKVSQQSIVKTYTVNKNKPLDFRGQSYNNSWQTVYSSLDTNRENVRTLVSGDTPPNKIPDYNAPSLEKFLKPYLDANKKVKIGPMDVIVFMELTHTNENDTGYDLQDLVMLITFRTN